MAVSVEKKLGNNMSRFRLTIQIDLSGFSFDIKDSKGSILHKYSNKFTADISRAEDIDLYILKEIDSQPLLSKKYESVALYFSTEKYTLVPDAFFEKDMALTMLKELYEVGDMDEVSFVTIPSQTAVLVYAIPNAITSVIFKIQKTAKFYPLSYLLVEESLLLTDNNRILVYYSNNLLHIVASERDELLFLNTYYVQDFTTFQYYLLLVVKEVMLNPKQTVLRVGNIPPVQMNTLRKYFKDVDKIEF